MTLHNYSNANNCVISVYKNMHENQNMTFVTEMMNKYENSYHIQSYNIWKLFSLLEKIKDNSDPDTTLPQIVHAYQTAESIKNNCITQDKLKVIEIKSLFSKKDWDKIPKNIKHIYNTSKFMHILYMHIKDWSWFPLIGLIHDLGKILLLKEYGGLKQHLVVGDIFPIGCSFNESNIFYQKGFYKNNVDYSNPKYNTKYGIYKPNCGFNKLTMSWGHDYFLYNRIQKSNHNLPKEALYLIRYHSFYPWHNSIGYQYLADMNAWMMLPLLKLFQKSDLYSKISTQPKYEEIEQKYKILVDKFIKDVKI